MKVRLLNLFNKGILSPWWIFFIDTLLTSLAYLMAIVIWINIDLNVMSVYNLMFGGIISVGVYVLSFLSLKTYRGVIRHTEVSELVRLVYSIIASMLLLNVYVMLGAMHTSLSYPVVLLQALFVLFILSGFRLLVRETYNYLITKKNRQRVLIYGSGDLGLLALKILTNDKKQNFDVVGFVDDDSRKWKFKLQGLPVMNLDRAIVFGKKKKIDVLVIAISELSKEKVAIATEKSLREGWEVKMLPRYKNLMNEKDYTQNIRTIKIEDLLGRDKIQLDLLKIRKGLKGKCILVSGAAGSIGSEITRQLASFSVKKLILLDQAESDLFDLQQELMEQTSMVDFELVVGDVSNYSRMQAVFETHKPHIVINAAAYKHVPLMEENPYEAINVNVRGTKNLADLSVINSVDKFVMVSTDKAVNPTSVMGASKRLCEIYIQSLSQIASVKTSFITTRFGNVLGSNGSVVPLFKKQIENGGPVTVTDAKIIRYFMTIPEACQLVLEATFMGRGGEIFVFDMGDPVKIIDLARRMIQLAGLREEKDIEIKITGLRPGEKLYEELLTDKENVKPTYNKKIMIAQVETFKFKWIDIRIKKLLEKLTSYSEIEIVSILEDILPDFTPSNPDYQTYSRKEVTFES